MKAFFLLAIVSVVLAVDVRRQFTEFQRTYGRSYDTPQEFDHRFTIFKQNLKRNQELSRLNPRATFGINKFSDLSQEEFAEQYLMKVDPSEFKRPAAHDFSIERPVNARNCKPNAKNYNWGTTCAATTPIYNQGQCGSCWAFSATETIESYFFLAGNPLTQLSMEQIVDCDTTDDGCNGGLPSNAYEYVSEAGGIEPYTDYPYVAENGVSSNCSFADADVVATVTNWTSINGESGLYKQTSSPSGGPVSVCVDASTWPSYTGGVLTTCPDDIDHCVQLVGYANYGDSDAYWVVRNSWGTSWGMDGFIHIAIGSDLCGIGDQATVVVATTA